MRWGSPDASMDRYTEVVTVWTGRLENGDYGRFSIADGRPVLERWVPIDLDAGVNNSPSVYYVIPWEEVDEDEEWVDTADGER